ncbi:MAG: pyridoxal 5'-phosphate synthase glutaminase subunit PdxT [Selenomonadaceae bacterium]
MKRIGVLALQGAVQEHLSALEVLGNIEARPVKTMAEIEAVDGLIFPGGESTAIGRLLQYFSLLEPLGQRIRQGLPVWGTCAGMILLAKEISGQQQQYFSAMDIRVRRNAYGSQLDSFCCAALIPAVSSQPLPLVFIRAPYIEMAGPEVEVLAEVDGHIVAARQKNMLVTSFHPELAKDISFHRYFADAIIKGTEN